MDAASKGTTTRKAGVFLYLLVMGGVEGERKAGREREREGNIKRKIVMDNTTNQCPAPLLTVQFVIESRYCGF